MYVEGTLFLQPSTAMGNLGATELLLVMGIPLLLLVPYVWSIVWAYRDAEARGKEGVLVAVLVALVAWPLGLLVWLFVRPSEGAA